MKLTITIPTYNRPEKILSQVLSLLPQLTDDVQLIVYDNCSDTPVSTLFEKNVLERIVIVRNPINIGRDQNQVRCLENVEKGWVWTLSDDDVVTENALQTIKKYLAEYSHCCYINFCNKKDFVAKSFEELVGFFSITGTFGISFFQSACLYNMDILRPYLWYFNDFLSSQIGQICMVMKYMEKTGDYGCVFSKESIIQEVPPGGWNPFDFIINSSIIIDKFHYKSGFLKKNLFKGMGDMYFTMLSSSHMKFNQFCYYHSYVVFKLGLFNVIRYNFVTFLGTVIRRIVPQKVFLLFRKYISYRYNKHIS